MNTALIVLDVQKIYTTEGSDLYCKDSSKTVDRINFLIGHFQSENLPVIYVRHQHKTDGSDAGRLFNFDGGEIEEINFLEGSVEVEYDARLSRPSKAVEIIKNRYSAFRNTELDRILRDKNIDRVAICGFMTNFCCASTAREALDRDYYVDFVADATGSPGTDSYDEKKVRSVVTELLGSGFARVFSAKEYLKEKR